MSKHRAPDESIPGWPGGEIFHYRLDDGGRVGMYPPGVKDGDLGYVMIVRDTYNLLDPTAIAKARAQAWAACSKVGGEITGESRVISSTECTVQDKNGNEIPVPSTICFERWTAVRRVPSS